MERKSYMVNPMRTFFEKNREAKKDPIKFVVNNPIASSVENYERISIKDATFPLQTTLQESKLQMKELQKYLESCEYNYTQIYQNTFHEATQQHFFPENLEKLSYDSEEKFFPHVSLKFYAYIDAFRALNEDIQKLQKGEKQDSVLKDRLKIHYQKACEVLYTYHVIDFSCRNIIQILENYDAYLFRKQNKESHYTKNIANNILIQNFFFAMHNDVLMQKISVQDWYNFQYLLFTYGIMPKANQSNQTVLLQAVETLQPLIEKRYHPAVYEALHNAAIFLRDISLQVAKNTNFETHSQEETQLNKAFADNFYANAFVQDLQKIYASKMGHIAFDINPYTPAVQQFIQTYAGNRQVEPSALGVKTNDELKANIKQMVEFKNNFQMLATFCNDFYKMHEDMQYMANFLQHQQNFQDFLQSFCLPITNVGVVNARQALQIMLEQGSKKHLFAKENANLSYIQDALTFVQLYNKQLEKNQNFTPQDAYNKAVKEYLQSQNIAQASITKLIEKLAEVEQTMQK